MPLTPNILKWIVVISLNSCLFILMGLFWYKQGLKHAAGNNTIYQTESALLRRASDSLKRVSVVQARQLDSLKRHSDTLMRRDSLYQSLLKGAYHNLHAIIQQYDALHRYDTFSAADIGRYLSDSLP